MGTTTSSHIEDLRTPSEMTDIWRYKIGVSGRGARAGEYTYTYVSPEYGIVISPDRLHPIYAYDKEDWKGIDNEKKLVPVRKSLLRAAQEYLQYHNTITNEIQRQLAVN